MIFLKRIKYFQKIFGEISSWKYQIIDLKKICTTSIFYPAGELGLPVVATNEVRFINKEDFEAHEKEYAFKMEKY
ncbi:MAG: hypothetical protein CM15mP13_2600 [Pseudomonadota bacterium]|nr:MAG: hypothetical protein CM15mP13_2600 [Pseudomonadota bacterium]